MGVQATGLGNCRLVQAGEPFIGKQNLEYAVGISAESVGAQGIHMQLVTIPPGGRSKTHKHATHETAIYALQGEAGVWHGERLEHHTIVNPGAFSISLPTCRTCRTTRVKQRMLSRSLREPIPMSRRAWFYCQSWTLFIRERASLS